MIKREHLEQALWKAADIMRGGISFYEAKSYLFRLLLLKRLSDVFEEEVEAIKREISPHNLACSKPYTHRFFVPDNSRWSYLQHLHQFDISNKLNEAGKAIEFANPELEGIFTSIDFGDDHNQVSVKQKASYWTRLMNHFSFFNLRNSNLDKGALGEACESLIEKIAISVGNKSGDFSTPSQVKKLLVRLLEPQENMSICDPACGAGGLLVECMRQMKPQRDTPNNLLLYGQEQNYETWAIAKINLLLHDIFEFDIRLGDVINDPQLIQSGKLMQFDRVVANPPFNLKNWRYEMAPFFNDRFLYGIPPQNKGDFAFIQHILSTLNSTGRAAVIVPSGVLFRGGVEGIIRRGIIEDNLIEAVIGLAPNLFYGTGIPTVILIFNRNKPAIRKGKILLIDASKEFIDEADQKDKSQNYLSNQHIDEIFTLYQGFQEKEGYSKVVSVEEIAANDYNLNINRYVLPTEDEINLDVEINDLGQKLLQLDAELAEAESEVNKCLHELGVRAIS